MLTLLGGITQRSLRVLLTAAGTLAGTSNVQAAVATPATVGLVDTALASAAMALLATLMMFAVRIALSKRGDAAPTWLALSCGCLSLTLLFATHSVVTLLPGLSALSSQQLGGAAAAALTWALTALGIEHWHLFGALRRRSLNVLIAATTLVSVAALAWPISMPLLLGWWIAIGAWGLYPVLGAAVAGKRYGLSMVLAAAPLLIGVTVDLGEFLGSGSGSPFALATMVSFAFIHSGVLVRQFIRAQRLATRLSAHLSEEVEMRTRELQQKNDRLEEAKIALQRANETLQKISITDGLTQVYNRMYFEQRLEQEWRRCARQGTLLSVLMIDADQFKRLNDTAGHLAGDRCLQEIAAELLRQFRRSGELVARYGGEEFIVLLPEAGHSRALAMAEGLRAAIERLSLPKHMPGPRVTISIGVSTTIPTADQPPEQLLAAADAALYEAKDSGRNCVQSIPLIGGRPLNLQQRLRN